MNYKTLSKKELIKEMEKIQSILDKIKEAEGIKRAKTLKIGAFTCKDIAVRYSDPDGYGELMLYTFYVKYDNKLYNFYYGKTDGGAGVWWPESENDMYMSPLFEFVPPGFHESCENCYKFRGTVEQAIKRLKKYGITDVELDKPDE